MGFLTLLQHASRSTGLLSALYMKNGEETPNPDPASGLYISNRSGMAIKAPIPESHIAFQMGEAMQVNLIKDLSSSKSSCQRLIFKVR